MADEDYQAPEEFDLDGGWTQGDLDIEAIALEYEWASWRDIIAVTDEIDEQNIRPGEYFSAADAIREAYERGILDYVELYWDGESWHIIVSYEDD